MVPTTGRAVGHKGPDRTFGKYSGVESGTESRFDTVSESSLHPETSEKSRPEDRCPSRHCSPIVFDFDVSPLYCFLLFVGT